MIITKLEQKDIPGCREIYNYYVKNTSFSLEETEPDGGSVRGPGSRRDGTVSVPGGAG